MKEIWKLITINDNSKYEISNFGRIRKINKDYRSPKYTYLKLGKLKPYYNISLTINSKQKTYLVHRLVAQTFIPNPNNFPQVSHIDGNKGNNKVDNLEWCTSKQNINHAINNGLWNHDNKGKFKKGIIPWNKNKKFDNNYIKKHYNTIKVNQYDLQNNFIKTWGSINEASRKLKINHANIISCCKHRYGYKSAGGFKWEYYTNEIKREHVE